VMVTSSACPLALTTVNIGEAGELRE